MADNFTKFGFQIHATPEQSAWLQELHATCCKLDGSYFYATIDPNGPAPVVPKTEIFDLAKIILPDQNASTGELQFSVKETSCCIYAETNGDVSYTASLLEEYMKHFDLPGVISFEWAQTCSKPRVDEFGGGAAVVMKNTVLIKSTSELIEELKKHALDKDDLFNALSVLYNNLYNPRATTQDT